MKEEDDVMWFTAIIAPSGTGKTQLAATAAQVDPENTRYIHCSPANEIDLQPFYKPHTAVSRVLFKLLEKFAGSELATVSGQLVGANGLQTAFCTDKGETGTDVLANFLDKHVKQQCHFMISWTRSNSNAILFLSFLTKLRLLAVMPMIA
jgi:hypothetical protein